MKLEIEIPDAWLDRLRVVKIPTELCGERIEERASYLLGEQLDSYEEAERYRQSVALHQKFGVRHPSEDDDISF